MAGRPAYSVRARALIIRAGQVLVFEQVDAGKKWYLLPGGEQKPGETLPETVARECVEELGCRVRVGELAYVRDYLALNHEHAADGDVHEVELTFLAELEEEPDPKRATQPDREDCRPCWLSVDEIDGLDLYPKAARDIIRLVAHGKPHPVYLGEID